MDKTSTVTSSGWESPTLSTDWRDYVNYDAILASLTEERKKPSTRKKTFTPPHKRVGSNGFKNRARR